MITLQLFLEQLLPSEPAEPCRKKIKLSDDDDEETTKQKPPPPVTFQLNVPSLISHQDMPVQSDNPDPNHQEPSPPSQELSTIDQPQNLSTRVISSAKPNYTYTDLITLALKDKTSLTVSEIYQWITSVQFMLQLKSIKIPILVKISPTSKLRMIAGKTVSDTTSR